MSEEIRSMLSEARETIAGRSDHHLPLPIRKRIWLIFGSVELDENRATRNEAWMKRTRLAIACCEKVMPIWNEYLADSDIASRGITLAKQYLEGAIDYDSALSQGNSIAGGLENVEGLSDAELNAVLVGHACVDALFTALGDCYCEDLDEEDEDQDDWDAAMFAAGAFSKGFPWRSPPYRSDPEKLLEFWSWYLDEVEKLAS